MQVANIYRKSRYSRIRNARLEIQLCHLLAIILDKLPDLWFLFFHRSWRCDGIASQRTVARRICKRICQSAWQTAEGLINMTIRSLSVFLVQSALSFLGAIVNTYCVLLAQRRGLSLSGSARQQPFWRGWWSAFTELRGLVQLPHNSGGITLL